MPNTFRATLSLLILSLAPITQAFAQSLSLNSTPIRATAAEEESVRALTEEYGRAIAAGDLDALRNFWNPQSANLASQLRSYKNVFAQARLELTDQEITRLEITGDRATSQLTVDERRLDRKTGAILLTFDPFRGACRSFEWIKTGGRWQLEREVLVQDELAATLEAARSDQERDTILDQEKRFVTNTLIGALGTRALRAQTRTEYDVALRYVELQRIISERMGYQVGVAAAWLNTAVVRNGQDEHELGLVAAHKALALYESLGMKRGLSLTNETLSNLYRALGDHKRAFDCATKSLRLAEEENHRRGIMNALSELAIIYGQQNNPEQALAHLERAYSLAQELGDNVNAGALRHDMALQYKRLGDHQRALDVYEQLLKQMETYGDKGGAAMVRDQIGRIFADQGRYEEALSYHRHALALLEAANKKRATVITLNNMSAVYLLQKNYAEALAASERALPLARDTERKVDVFVALTNLGYAQFGLNRLAEARESFSEAVSLVENLRTRAAGGVEERQRYFEGGMRAHHGLLSVLVKQNQVQDALNLAERAKARALLDMLQQGRVSVQKAMTAKEQEQEQQLKSQLTQLNKQLARVTQSDKRDAARIAAAEAQLEKARLSYEAFQDALYAAHPELKTQRGEAPIINAEELGELLPHSSSVLLEYVVTNEQTYLFAITRPAEKVQIDLYTLPIRRAELAKEIESFRKQLATRDLGFRTSANKLYESLLKPAQAQLHGKTNVVIAPDGNLWDLPFQALVNNGGRFLIEEAAVNYAPSLTVLREMSQRRLNRTATHAPPALLAFGNPVTPQQTATSSLATLRTGNLDPLPEAGEEVKALARLYGATRSRVYLGADAREDRVKTEAGRAGILHFTTHGTLNNAAPMYSYLTLAEGGPNDDGLLEAWELMQLNLKAELAVLSACETARGRIGAGEGVIGFSWAMFIAGVPSTVVSQWKVESASTRDLMVNFHRSLIATKTNPTKSEALRQAALKLMRKAETSHPFYWAGFVLVGDGG
ncbi:MAG TPA: CHAT domain-containing tetratricopeptide repeat protein [Pyrinomonadaceae bacterium]|nr:CHAT domain-containing tetratricopeptide repeat protein [Pyrinomonadaceae bacterium]